MELPESGRLLAPAFEHALQALLVIDDGQQLHFAAAGLGRTETHQVELAGVVNPSGAVQRTV